MESQLGNKLTSLIPGSLAKKFIHIKSLFVFENKINRPADFAVRFTSPFAVRFFDRFNQPGIGRKILDGREAFDILNFVKHDKMKGGDIRQENELFVVNERA
jgi:hypothetical protein